MTRAELRAACPSNDTGGYIEWLKSRVLALTADEEPRKAAERIVQSHLDNAELTDDDLRNQITTAIQAAVEAERERGRKARAEIETWILAAYDKAFPHYTWVDAQTAIDMMVAEITTLRMENLRRNHIGNVNEFMEKFGQHIGDTPGFPPQEVLDLRVKLMAEEFAEMLDAGGYPFELRICKTTGGLWEHYESNLFGDESFDGHTPNFPAFIDALLDLEYVILGTHVTCGVDPQPIWERVHASNMLTQPAADKHSKITKPADWAAPDIAGALREQGWQGGAE